MITPEEARKRMDRKDQDAAGVLLDKIEETIIIRGKSMSIPHTTPRVREIIAEKMDAAGWIITWRESILYWRPRP